MNTVDIGRCSKRIVQYLWDPEPRNDEDPTSSIWCLGIEYHPEKDASPRGETRKPKQNIITHVLLKDAFVPNHTDTGASRQEQRPR